jgi:hypothetical protein
MDISQLLNGSPNPLGRSTTTLRAMVTDAPIDDTDELRVVAQGYSHEFDYLIPAGQWMPRGNSLPERGASCLLVLDEVGDAYVPLWDGPNDFALSTDISSNVDGGDPDAVFGGMDLIDGGGV